jgi:hypothetical protein
MPTLTSARSVLGLVASVVVTAAAVAGPVRSNAGFTSNTLPANDDGSTGSIVLPFSANFFGLTFSSLFVNNNGNVTFGSPLSTFTPFNLNTTNAQIIAPFFADVDTRGAGSQLVRYGVDTVNGRTAFGVNWVDVGYFASRTDKLNSFQLVLIDRADTGAGNFDIEFNYDKILWETGEASGGTNGLGGSSARAGFANGTGNPGTFFELPGSAINGAFLDGGPLATRLITSSNIGVDGRWLFSSRNGRIVPQAIPEPGTLAAFGFGLAALAPVARRLRRVKATA